MNVLVAGGGLLGAQSAYLLTAIGHQVTVIDRNRTRLDELSGKHVHRLVHGDACESHVLETAGALNVDLLLAATGADADNLVIALLAKRRFTIARILARVNDPDNSWLFDARWGVDTALPANTALASLIGETADAGNTFELVHRSPTGVTVIETHVEDESAAAGRTVAELTLPTGTVVAAVVQGGQPVVPGGDYRFQPGDIVLVITDTGTDTGTYADIHNTFRQRASQ